MIVGKYRAEYGNEAVKGYSLIPYLEREKFCVGGKLSFFLSLAGYFLYSAI